MKMATFEFEWQAYYGYNRIIFYVRTIFNFNYVLILELKFRRFKKILQTMIL